MGFVEDVKQIAQDLIVPDLKSIQVRLDHVEQALEKLEAKIDKRFDEVLIAVNRVQDYNSLLFRVAALEQRIGRQQ